MASMPGSKAVAPSSTLLKFLRAQKDGYSFFTQNRAAQNSRVQTSRTFLQHVSVKAQSRASSARQMATLAPMHSQVESSLLAIDCFWSRPSTSADTSYFSRNSVSVLPRSRSLLCRSIAQSLQSERRISTETDCDQPAWWRFWAGRRLRRRPRAELRPGDLPPSDVFIDDGASFGRILRPANELRLRCTEFDENGNVTLVNGEFKKSELIAKYGLLPRDLRKIDSSLLPNVLVRPSAILINLLHLRVLIKHNRVLVLDAYGSTDTYTQSLFMYDLEGKLRSIESRSAGHLPYEFRALESVLISVTSSLEAEFEGVRDPVVRVLRELESDIDRDKLRHLLIYSKKLSSFEQKARLVRDAIDDLLEADDDLAAMYLSEKASGKERPEDDHTEIEMLLESYYKLCDEIVQGSSNIVNNIRNTEEIVKAILDANRNSLMLLDLKVSVGTLGIGAGTFVAALYGMNLKNFIEESDLGFFAVSAWCTVFGILVCYYGFKKLRSIQRVSMWGGGLGNPAKFSHRGQDTTMLSGVARRERAKLTRDAQSHWLGIDPLPALTPSSSSSSSSSLSSSSSSSSSSSQNASKLPYSLKDLRTSPSSNNKNSPGKPKKG